MKTLIELYDDRPLENVLGAEMLGARQVVYLCARDIYNDHRLHERLRRYFQNRGLDTQAHFVACNMFDVEDVADKLKKAMRDYEDCVLDITGGTDAALFAGGYVYREIQIPVVTYSRKRGMFFSVERADFAHRLQSDVRLKVEDCFLMAGGAMRAGRTDNAAARTHFALIDPFFEAYLAVREQWTNVVAFIQRASRPVEGDDAPLEARCAWTVKGERASRIDCPQQALARLERAGLIEDLALAPGEEVWWRFADAHVRAWLRDVGSVLELAVYKACVESGAFDDVRLSAIVDWSGDPRGVSNEIDVMATCGVTPVFISCKTCDVHTEALNELAILRDRFGGQDARAVIVTAEPGRSAMRDRARALSIDVIDREDLVTGRYKSALAALTGLR